MTQKLKSRGMVLEQWTALEAAHLLSDVDPDNAEWEFVDPFQMGRITKKIPSVLIDCHTLSLISEQDTYFLNKQQSGCAAPLGRLQQSIERKIDAMLSKWILDRKTILERVADKIQTFIQTFIEGMGGSV